MTATGAVAHAVRRFRAPAPVLAFVIVDIVPPEILAALARGRRARARLERMRARAGARSRRENPVSALLPATQTWLAALPDPVRPRHVAEQFPRIANALAACWDAPDDLARLFPDLLLDRRGGRQGFPPAVHADLVALWRWWWTMPMAD